MPVSAPLPAACLALLVLLASACTPTPSAFDGTLPPLSGISLDAPAEAWARVPTVPLVAGDTLLQGRSGFAGPDDLHLAAQMAWDPATLHFRFVWTDDTWDVVRIPADSIRWYGPGTMRADRMYLYDNLALRLRLGDYYYGLWLTADSTNTFVLQSGEATEMPFRRDAPTYPVSPGVVARETGPQQVDLRVSIPWDALRRTAAPGDSLNVQFILTDSDAPGQPLPEKHPHIAYLVWQQDVVLGE